MVIKTCPMFKGDTKSLIHRGIQPIIPAPVITPVRISMATAIPPASKS